MISYVDLGFWFGTGAEQSAWNQAWKEKKNNGLIQSSSNAWVSHWFWVGEIWGGAELPHWNQWNFQGLRPDSLVIPQEAFRVYVPVKPFLLIFRMDRTRGSVFLAVNAESYLRCCLINTSVLLFKRCGIEIMVTDRTFPNVSTLWNIIFLLASPKMQRQEEEKIKLTWALLLYLLFKFPFFLFSCRFTEIMPIKFLCNLWPSTL